MKKDYCIYSIKPDKNKDYPELIIDEYGNICYLEEYQETTDIIPQLKFVRINAMLIISIIIDFKFSISELPWFKILLSKLTYSDFKFLYQEHPKFKKFLNKYNLSIHSRPSKWKK